MKPESPDLQPGAALCNVTRVRAVTSRGAMGCRKVQQLASLLPPQQSTSNISARREVYVGQEEGSWGCSSATGLELDRALQSPMDPYLLI